MSTNITAMGLMSRRCFVMTVVPLLAWINLILACLSASEVARCTKISSVILLHSASSYTLYNRCTHS